MKNVKKVLVLLCVLAAIVTAGCSSGDGDSSEEIVNFTGYSLNYDSSYHRVVKYGAVSLGSNTYDVRELSYYYFSVSNSNYKNRTGSELCDIVRTNAVAFTSSELGVTSRESTVTFSDSSGNVTKTFYIHKGQKYTIYYFF